MSREMKDSGIEWIGKIPKHLEVVRVKNKYLNIKQIVGDKADNYDRLSLTLNGVLKRSKDDANGLQPQKFEGYQILSKNQLVFKLIDLENVNTSRVGISPYTGLVSPAYIILENEKESKFGYYYFLSMWHREIFNKLGGDGVRSNLNSKDLLNIPYLSVPDKEQENIADYLDKRVSEIDNIITQTTLSIEEYKKYKQSLITKTVTKGLNPDVEMKDSGIEWIGKIPQNWSCKKIKYVTDIFRGLFNHRPRNDERYYGGEYPFIQTGDVAKAQKYINKYSQTLNELGKNVSKEFPKGTLVMTIAANIGDVAILNFDAYFPDSIIGVIPHKEYCCNYLYYILCAMKDKFLRTAIVSTQMNLNIERVKELFIAITENKNEQKQIVNYLDNKCNEIDNLIAQKQQLLTDLESYKKSLIYECVTGKREVD